MSVAPELPPVVHIPARARRRPNALTFVAPGVPALPSALLESNPAPELDGLLPIVEGSRLRLVVDSNTTSVRGLTSAAEGRALSRPVVASPLRVTVRGWIVLGLLAAVALAALLVIAHASVPASAGPAGPAGAVPTVVTVHDGDTLWSIAGRVAPGHDPRIVVAKLQRINHLSASDLVPGQVLHTQ